MSALTSRRVGFDAAAAIKDAIEKSPPRTWRRIWIDGERDIRVETDGVLHIGIGQPRVEDEIVNSVDGGVDMGTHVEFPGWTVGAFFDRIIAAHLRHGWTLHERSETEARLWKAAT